MTGEIKRLETERGFGFIRPEGATEDVFFHSSALQGLVFDNLTVGQLVEFDKQPDERDPRRSRAANVRAAQAVSAPRD
ncbi:MAG: cold shock domain-containing protein [Dehalococcoidia bacterium]